MCPAAGLHNSSAGSQSESVTQKPAMGLHRFTLEEQTCQEVSQSRVASQYVPREHRWDWFPQILVSPGQSSEVEQKPFSASHAWVSLLHDCQNPHCASDWHPESVQPKNTSIRARTPIGRNLFIITPGYPFAGKILKYGVSCVYSFFRSAGSSENRLISRSAFPGEEMCLPPRNARIVFIPSFFGGRISIEGLSPTIAHS